MFPKSHKIFVTSHCFHVLLGIEFWGENSLLSQFIYADEMQSKAALRILELFYLQRCWYRKEVFYLVFLTKNFKKYRYFRVISALLVFRPFALSFLLS